MYDIQLEFGKAQCFFIFVRLTAIEDPISLRPTQLMFKIVKQLHRGNMKWGLTTLLVVLCALSCKNTEHRHQPRLKYPPPGTNHLLGNLFIDETEISNQTWREYMYWTKRVYGDGSPEFKFTLPDTLVWKNYFYDFKVKYSKDLTDIESLTYLYLRNPQYSHFPVVGISYEQAVAFCAWRTNRVNEVLYIDKHKNVTFPIDSSIAIPKRVLFRLPKESEWEYAAQAGFDTTRYADKNTDKIYYNTHEASAQREEMESYNRFTPMLEISLQPDKYNRYHLIGNVAEMISTKGIAKGGSYIHTLEQSYYKNRIAYSQPTYWLGFRCVCEILQ